MHAHAYLSLSLLLLWLLRLCLLWLLLQSRRRRRLFSSGRLRAQACVPGWLAALCACTCALRTIVCVLAGAGAQAAAKCLRGGGGCGNRTSTSACIWASMVSQRHCLSFDSLQVLSRKPLATSLARSAPVGSPHFTPLSLPSLPSLPSALPTLSPLSLPLLAAPRSGNRVSGGRGVPASSKKKEQEWSSSARSQSRPQVEASGGG